MATIRVSDEVKERLENLKRDDESFDDLLDRSSRRGWIDPLAGFHGSRVTTFRRSDGVVQGKHWSWSSKTRNSFRWTQL